MLQKEVAVAEVKALRFAKKMPQRYGPKREQRCWSA
jgi:hypothetical protein